MSQSEIEKIEKAKIILEKIAKGINPITEEQIGENSFLNDARIIRCFYFISEILDNVKKGVYSTKKNNVAEFIITAEQKKMVEFPPGRIGVNEFSKCINQSIDISMSKKLTGVELNKRLKKLGILSEESTQDGKTRTIINEKSIEYGFESERKSYNGNEYDMVMLNDNGKKYLLENIESIMKVEV